MRYKNYVLLWHIYSDGKYVKELITSLSIPTHGGPSVSDEVDKARRDFRRQYGPSAQIRLMSIARDE